jgi:hypothetical protein
MVQTIKLTHKQKVKMYKKMKKKDLIEMLIATNEVIESMQPTTVYDLPSTGNIHHDSAGWEIICSCTEPNHGL